jgi:small subunit ribosomal protein S1
VSVVIKDVDQDKKRIGLSMRDAAGDPWVGIEDRYARGRPVQGVVEKREPFGLFVKLEPGVVGLLPKSKLDQASDSRLQSLKEGEQVTVAVESIDPQKRRISLTPAQGSPSEDWKAYAAPQQGLGTLGEKLKQALNDKEST